jgi:hypothetical protein
MYTTQFSCYGLRPVYSRRLAVLIAFSLVPLVCVCVNVYLGDQVPKALKGSNPYFLIAFVLLTAWWLIVYFTRRFKINLYGDEQNLSIEVNDPELNDPVLIRYPFTLSRQWIRRKNGETHIKELFLTFLDQHQAPVLTFKGSLGDLRDVPSGFVYIEINSDDRRHLKLSDQLYTAKVKDMDNALQIHLNYLAARNPNRSNP